MSTIHGSNSSELPLQPVSQEVYEKKYQLRDKNNTPIDTDVAATFKRVATALASVERKDQEIWQGKFYKAMMDGAIPAGRIISNLGAEEYKPEASTINCTVSNKINDSMEGILQCIYEAGLTLKAGCGIGYEFSTLRPKGALVKGVGATTSGPLPFMDIYDKLCSTISSAGGRRGAQMATFDIGHPDILDFIQAKREDGRFRQFNVSVLVPEAFLGALKNDDDWHFIFPVHEKEAAVTDNAKLVWIDWHDKSAKHTYNEEGECLCKIYKTLPARDVWDVIMKSAYNHSEPGILFIDEINHWNNTWWCEEIRGTNPCCTGDTEILTDFGYERIDSLVNKTVNVWNGFEFSSVVPKITGINQDILDIEFSDGNFLSCTPYHKFVLSDGSKIEAKELIEGDKLSKFSFPIIHNIEGLTFSRDQAYTQGFYSGDGQKNSNIVWLYEEKIRLADYMAVHSINQYVRNGTTRCTARMSYEPLPKDFVPGSDYTLQSRLDWLAGLMDSDGTVSKDGVVQIWSINRDFLQRVKKLIQISGATGTLIFGSAAGKRMMPDGNGGSKECTVQECYRLVISANSIQALVKQGLYAHRLDLTYIPQRDAARFIKVRTITERPEKEALVYCFVEPKNHTGVFNGIMTGQCGEQPLPPYGACLLGSINLTKFVRKPFTKEAYFDIDLFKETVKVFTRMLDNVVEKNGLPLEQQQAEIIRKRRHGMGITGLGSALTMLQIVYGSTEAINWTNEVTFLLAIEGWRTGIELAKEKGPAPIMEEQFTVTEEMQKNESFRNAGWDLGGVVFGKDLFVHSNYIQKLLQNYPALLNDIKKYGCRFTHHTSIAPTGTISLALCNNVSNGIEPSFAQKYVRNLTVEGKKTRQQMDVFSYELLAYKEWIDSAADPDKADLPHYFVEADNIAPSKHIDMQAAAQEWIDSSISKTINLPTEISFENFKSVYSYGAEKHLKGTTVFRYNPETLQGVLVKNEELENTFYKFTLEDGSEVEVKGSDDVEYEGEIHNAAMLFDAIKEGRYTQGY